MTALVNIIDNFNRRLGEAVAWLALVMVLLQFAVVILRYVFSLGFIPMQEAVWHLHGLLFMLGAAYTLLEDGHVRIDIFYRGLSVQRRAVIDLAGSLLFIVPVCLLTLYASWDYVLNAIYDFQGGTWILEASPEFGGLPLIWAYKLVIWLFALTLLAQGISLAVKSAAALGAREDASAS